MPKLTGVWESPPAGSGNVLVTVATDSATVVAAAALASDEVSATTTSDSLFFEQPPVAPVSNASNEMAAPRESSPRGVREDRRSVSQS